MRADGVDTADEFERKMSTLSAHEMLRAKLSALPHVGALNLWNAKGWLINSSEMWPVPDSQHRGPALLPGIHLGTADARRDRRAGRQQGDQELDHGLRAQDHRPHGEIIGFAIRGVEPSHFENFVASLALDSDTAISMIHRDGTIIARYPKDDKLIGLNVANTAAFQQRAGDGRQHFRTLHQREVSRTRSAPSGR